MLYLATLAGWVTLPALGLTGQVLGWDWWNPKIGRPLYHLLTLPVKALPAGAQISALNAFAALCSALTLALLARSVAILPQDRTRDQRARLRDGSGLLDLPANWLPPLLAVLAAGLQLSFWENATAATGEALGQLCRCGREYLEGVDPRGGEDAACEKGPFAGVGAHVEELATLVHDVRLHQPLHLHAVRLDQPHGRVDTPVEPLALRRRVELLPGQPPVVLQDAEPAVLIVDLEFLALVGPSGSGKTTFLNLAGALDVPTAGELTVLGRRITDLSRRARAELRLHSIGFVFQAFNLVPVLTARENVEFVLELQGVGGERRQRSAAVLQELGLSELADRRPSELSGGQQQRVAVARAVAARPALVLADEPTANLDGENAEVLMHMMRDLRDRHEMTFVFSTHDPRVVAHAVRVVTLVDGTVARDELKPGEAPHVIVPGIGKPVVLAGP